DMIARADAAFGKCVREAGRPLVELRVGQSPSAVDEGLAIRDGVRHALDQVGKVELHQTISIPVRSSGSGYFGSICSRVSTRMVDTAQLRYHSWSAGMAYHGASRV